ncbi:hypothetical protein T07_2229 [Trichinella nelsoni]|uniref:Uncharacterized protein n=1 Tax=Trichinella nelsoni TaxID=6336 RepID=A0A0V0RF96_9BILA|nr:hypothetical protein T07_2229 [Trichinella nelsoni]
MGFTALMTLIVQHHNWLNVECDQRCTLSPTTPRIHDIVTNKHSSLNLYCESFRNAKIWKKEYLGEHLIEELTDTETGKNWYLPHHAVICKDKITQYRDTYVNQHLHRLRLALKADISKMFFLSASMNKTEIYLLLPKYSRNTFTTSKSCSALSRSPCFVTCVNRNHERKYQSPEAVNEVLKNMYVDDLVFSIHEEEGF